jgi:hypothetical protein
MIMVVLYDIRRNPRELAAPHAGYFLPGRCVLCLQEVATTEALGEVQGHGVVPGCVRGADEVSGNARIVDGLFLDTRIVGHTS